MLSLWRPQRDLFGWSREFDDFFGWGSGNGEQISFSPAVDLEEEEERYVLRADVPGVKEKDIEIKVHEGVLSISGRREESKEQKSERGNLRERRFGSFCRQFRLGDGIDSTKIEASYSNGELVVVLPKREETKPRQIEVKSS